ncbi:hypothetical protein [Mycolicibacterium sp. lyk4-40-TYG-92]|uniref:hypothetical protein n=1 Tax=Mycolicibacterium sp. lyk4-40-TYG-92 TaxID=3040295 RepID=UPI002551179A|nr:hypothetical protein [Mycolicibacterium sp. lyk4-40-TYG-92]
MTQPPPQNPWDPPPPGQPAWQPQPGWPAPTPQPWAGQPQPNYGAPNMYPGFPPPPRKSGVKPWMWVVVVVVVLFVIGGVANVVRKGLHTTAFGTQLKSGQCVTTGDYEKFHFTSTSCESSDAVYELAGETSKGLCPDGKAPSEGPYFYATSNQDDPKAATLCFALNLHEGDCYALDLTGKSIKNIDCAQAPTIANSHTGVFKVAQRVDGSVDESACATAAKAMVFTAPKRVYCLTKLVE